MLKLFKIIQNNFLDEISNWILWLVVSFALGIGVYFSLSHEPSLYAVSSAALLAFALVLLMKDNKRICYALLPVFFFFFGIAIASWRTHSVQADKITTRVEHARIYGTVEKINPVEEKAAKLVLRVKKIYSKEKVQAHKLQVTSKNWSDEVRVGDFVTFSGAIFPPMKQMFPGGYDFARHAYFNEIGGSVFSVSKIKILEDRRVRTWDRMMLDQIENVRVKIFKTLNHELGQVNGTVAAALMVGEQRAVKQEVLDDMRNSGLIHVLSVSGLHMTLVSIICFFFIRRVLSYSTYLSQRYNTKKIAAYFSLVITLIYLLLSGMQVAAVRSFVMVALVIIAILMDRQDNAKRAVFVAAFLILLITPEAIFHPGFQMSFSATLALVSLYEVCAQKFLKGKRSDASIFGKIRFYFFGVLVSSMIAGSAASMFVIYHFHNYSNYSVIANLLVSPVVSFIIMPSVVLTFFLLPIGLQSIALYPLNFGIKLMLKIAAYVSSIPFSGVILPTIHVSIPLLFAFGLLWLCIWERRWRFFGLAPIALSFVLIYLTPFPHVIIDAKTKSVVMKKDDGKLVRVNMGQGRVTSFNTTQWLTLLKSESVERLKKLERYTLQGAYHVDLESQVVPGKLVRGKEAREFSQMKIINARDGRTMIVCKEDIDERGTHFVYLSDDGARTMWSIDRNVARPWS